MAEVNVPDLPKTVTREQVAASLDALGVPGGMMAIAVEIHNHEVIVTHLVAGGQGRAERTVIPVGSSAASDG